MKFYNGLHVNRLTVSTSQLIWFLSISLPFQYQFVNSLELGNLPVYLTFGLICIFGIRNFLRRIPKNILYILILFLIVFLGIPTFAFRILDMNGLFFATGLVVFAMTTAIIGQYMATDYKRYIYGFTVANQMHLIYSSFNHIYEFNSRTILSVLYATDNHVYTFRYRAWLGFSHPNWIALFFLMQMILLFACTKICEKKRKKYLIILIFLNAIPLLCTGSRTAIINCILFFLINTVISSRHAYQRKLRIYAFGIFLFIVGVFALLSYTERIAEFSSGRVELVIDRIAGVNSLWFGNRVNSTSVDVTNIIENYYVTHILRFGLLSLLIFLYAKYRFWFYGVKQMLNDSQLSWIPVFFIVMLVYGMGEAVVFNQAVSLSFLFLVVSWTSCFSAVHKNIVGDFVCERTRHI